MKQKKAILEAYNKTAKAYANQFFNELEKKPLDRLLLQHFAREWAHQGALLDLACGPGQTTNFLYQSGVRNLTGLDLSEEMIQIAKTINPPAIQFTCGNLLQMDFEDQSFANAICFYGIVHFTTKELILAFQEVQRILKPGGTFLFSFHIGKEINALEEFLGEKVKMDFYFFEVEKILELLVQGNWQIKEVIERYPYAAAEYPSKRAYITVSKKS